jgi:hypothetical protein
LTTVTNSGERVSVSRADAGGPLFLGLLVTAFGAAATEVV